MRVAIDARKIADFGIGTYIRGLLAGLDEIREPGEDYVALVSHRIPDLPVDQQPVDAGHYTLREIFTVGRAAARAGADVFHAPHYVLPFTRLPTVVTIHDLIHLRTRHANPLAPVYARAMLRRAAAAGEVLTVSHSVAADIERTLGRQATVTPNGVGTSFTPEGAVAPGRYFLFVGNDKPHKNVEAASRAMEIVRAVEPGIDLVLAGGRFERFRDRARLTGFVETAQLAALYRGAIALLMPSREEGFGLPALEAMASGCPVITSNAPALLEVTGDAALHADADSAADLAAAMMRLLDDEPLRRDLRTRGLARARRFSWKHCAELTRECYRRVVR